MTIYTDRGKEMTSEFCKAYCKLHMQEFERGKRHGRWTFLWNEDRGYFRMRRHAKRALKAKNKAVK